MTIESEITLYEGGMFNQAVENHACNLPPALVSTQPLNTATIYHVLARESGRNIDTIFPLMVAYFTPEAQGADQPYIRKVLRVIGTDPRYVMEALVFETRVTKKITGGLLTNLHDTDTIVGFNIRAKVDGEHHPAIRAKHFIPWALEVLNLQQRVDYVIADYEPGSDTYNQFAANYHPGKRARNRDMAMQKAMLGTWGHEQIVDAGYELDPEVGVRFVAPVKGLVKNVMALYRKATQNTLPFSPQIFK